MRVRLLTEHSPSPGGAQLFRLLATAEEGGSPCPLGHCPRDSGHGCPRALDRPLEASPSRIQSRLSGFSAVAGPLLEDIVAS